MALRTQTVRGVTLVELLVVLVIISLALGLAGPAITAGYDAMGLRTTGRQLLTTFRWAQSEARRRQRTTIVVIEEQRAAVVLGGVTLRTLEFRGVRAASPSNGTLEPAVFLPSGQILFPSGLHLVTERGRTGILRLGPPPQGVTFSEEADAR